VTATTDLRTQPPIAKAELAKVERPESLRQTVISKFDACPRSFYLYCKYDGGAPAARLDRGIVFHEFVERAVRMMIDTDETSMPPEVAKDLIGSIITERKDLVVPEYEQNALRAMAWHWANATIIDPEEVVGLEQKIELALPGGKVHGTPDFATITQFGYAQIDDYKTSLAIPSMDELENGAKSFQGRLYCLLFAFGIPEGESLPLGKGLEEFRFRTVYPRFVTDDGRARQPGGHLLPRSARRLPPHDRVALGEDRARLRHGRVPCLTGIALRRVPRPCRVPDPRDGPRDRLDRHLGRGRAGVGTPPDP
jgi:hypothetical protein